MSRCDNVNGGEENMIEQVVMAGVVGAAPVIMRTISSLF